MPLSCDALPEQSSGSRTLGLKVPETSEPGRPSLGYYVLATRNGAVASRLSSVLKGLSAHCGPEDDSLTLNDLALIVADHQVDWRAVHFGNHGGRVFSFDGGRL